VTGVQTCALPIYAEAVEAILVHVGQVVKLALGEATDTVFHPQDAIDDSNGVESLADAFDDADEGLVDDGGRSAGLADGNVAFKELGERHMQILGEAGCSGRIG